VPSDPFYSSRAWQRMRAVVLRDCDRRCAIKGCMQAAKHVDHRISRRERPDLALTASNLVPLCQAHHNAKTNRHDGGFGRPVRRDADPYAGLRVRGCDASGMPLDPDHPWRRGR
jgi:5-methylcytosine-specific restriction enzyme A